MLQDMNHRGRRGRRPVKITKSSYEELKLKDHRANQFKAKSQPSGLQQSEKAYNKAMKKKLRLITIAAKTKADKL